MEILKNRRQYMKICIITKCLVKENHRNHDPEITSMPSVSFQSPVKVCLEETNKFIKCITNIKYDLSECEVMRDSLNDCIKRNSD